MYEMHPVEDLSVLWDEDASRHARVLVTEGRIEIVLDRPDDEWVQRALNNLNGKASPMVVIASPST